MRRTLLLIAVVLLTATAAAGFVSSTSAQDQDCQDCVRLNHVQVLGTHNSYHLEPYPEALALIETIDPNAALSFEYSHRSLTEQLGQLETYIDWERFARDLFIGDYYSEKLENYKIVVFRRW